MKTILIILSFCISIPAIFANTADLCKDYQINKDDYSTILIDLESGNKFSKHNENNYFNPGSVLKLFTGFYGLSILGPNYKFVTKVGYNGTIKQGVLKGDLYLIGGGDPFLTSAELFNLAQNLVRTGIKKVTGNFYFDDSFFRYSKHISTEAELDKTDNPGISGLSAEFNRFVVSKEGNRYVSIPALDRLVVKQSNSKFGANEKFSIKETKKSETWTMGKYSYKTRENLPVRAPGEFTAEYFRYFANRMNVVIPPAKRKIATSDITIISTHESKKLLTLVESMFEYSNNLFAETILMAASNSLSKKKLSIENSAKSMKSWYEKKLKFDFQKSVMINGSGLGHKNRVNAKVLATFLQHSHNKFFADRSFWSLLAISGAKGWLYRRMNRQYMTHRVWGKTGSLDFAANISGFFFSKKSKPFGFVIFVNDLKKRTLLESEKTISKIENAKKSAPGWSRNIKKFQNELIEGWVNSF
jgi:serine-type D-Ala-D-Ala carboxypeptidase/endopeptidase (penicillin-binding protein 4)